MSHSYLMKKRRALMAALDLWYQPPGMAATNVLAAYQFKGIASEAAALQDLSMYRRDLTKGSQTYNNVSYTPTWSSASGFTFDAVHGGASGYLDNSGLDNAAIKAAVVRYANLTQTNRGYLITAGGADGSAQIYAATTVYIKDDGLFNYTGPGFVVSPYSSASWVGTVGYVSTGKTSGVIGANFADDKALFLDGIRTATQNTDSGKTYTDLGGESLHGYTFGNSHSSKSDLNNATFAGKVISEEHTSVQSRI